MNWVKWATLFWAVPALAAELPYAFNYGGVPSAHLDGESRVVSEDADRRVSTNVWTAPDGLLRVVTRTVEYKRFGAVEYAPRLECVGTNATKIVDNFRSLSLRRMAPGAKVRALKGTTATERDFEAVHTTLGKDGTNVKNWACAYPCQESSVSRPLPTCQTFSCVRGYSRGNAATNPGVGSFSV